MADYIDTRSHIDIAPILEKLKAERNEAYRQGQIFFYQVAPKFDLQQFEILNARTNTKLMTSKHFGPLGEDMSLSPEAAERDSLIGMRYMTGQYCKEKQVEYPTDTTNAFWEGARDAFMKIYSKIKPKET